MPDFLATASAWLDNTLKASVSQTVRYYRGSDYVDVSATFELSNDAAEASPEAQRTWRQTNYEILTSDLVIAGHEILPQRGDRIEFTPRTTKVTYEVLPDEITGKCFVFIDDSTQNMLRVHTKEVG